MKRDLDIKSMREIKKLIKQINKSLEDLKHGIIKKSCLIFF